MDETGCCNLSKFFDGWPIFARNPITVLDPQLRNCADKIRPLKKKLNDNRLEQTNLIDALGNIFFKHF